MDITTIGEVLIDLTQTKANEQGIAQYSANPGGAPANLAVAASRLGATTAFIGKVGADSFGLQLKDCLSENNVDISGIVTTDTPTTLAVVSVDSTGERSFSFYRSPGADTLLSSDEISNEQLQDTKILHFGSVSLTSDPSRTATLYAVNTAKKMNKIISYDPNYRPNLWKSEAIAIDTIKSPLHLVDILKVSDEELLLLTGTDNLEKGTETLAKYGISLILVTLGPNGAYYRFKDSTGHVNGFPCTVGDTNGAGDTFFGALLSQLVKHSDLNTLTPSTLENAITFANKAASITTSRFGAIPAMPTLNEINSL